MIRRKFYLEIRSDKLMTKQERIAQQHLLQLSEQKLQSLQSLQLAADIEVKSIQTALIVIQQIIYLLLFLLKEVLTGLLEK